MFNINVPTSTDQERAISLLKNSADEIIPGLFLGNLSAGEEALIQLIFGDTTIAILRCAKFSLQPDFEVGLKNLGDISGNFLAIPVEDDPTQEIVSYFKETNQFIEKALSEKKRVVVHCMAGASRSPSFVIAYLMYKHQLNFQDAYHHVLNKRPCVDVINFKYQLQKYEQALKKDSADEELEKKIPGASDQIKWWRKVEKIEREELGDVGVSPRHHSSNGPMSPQDKILPQKMIKK